ncbi:RNA polymerase sigma factor [Bernardetia sp.]|uniref:RNA polymerase sigma factor n=1 Tax=Bernardetia sp. TaxID=1937974 RepID=UPI0025B8E85C|nr:sigma-70 family RNA polymerase sigma factor [Bernardetia sp.]
MTNQDIFDYINDGNYRPVLKYFNSFSESFYFFCKKQDKLKLLSEHQIQAIFDDACICMYEKIEAKKITIRQITSSIKTMIFGIGRNMILEQGRKQSKYNNLHSSLDKNLKEIENIEYDDDGDEWLSELQIQQLNEALSKLPPRSYMLVAECFMENKSYSEVAKEQDYATVNAVRVALHRTLKELKKIVIQLQKRDGNY